MLVVGVAHAVGRPPLLVVALPVLLEEELLAVVPLLVLAVATPLEDALTLPVEVDVEVAFPLELPLVVETEVRPELPQWVEPDAPQWLVLDPADADDDVEVELAVGKPPVEDELEELLELLPEHATTEREKNSTTRRMGTPGWAPRLARAHHTRSDRW